MCKAPKIPAAPAVDPAPTREQIEAEAAAGRVAAVEESRKLTRSRASIYGNIHSPTGRIDDQRDYARFSSARGYGAAAN
jgi:hypothetical protein